MAGFFFGLCRFDAVERTARSDLELGTTVSNHNDPGTIRDLLG